MKYVVMAALVALAGAQEPVANDVQALIDRLGDPNIEDREAALQKLVDLGEPAVAALREARRSGDHEVEQRADHALAEIRLRARIRKVYRERPPLTVSFSNATVETVVDELARKSGVAISTADLPSGRRAGLALERGTLLQALDLVCRELGDRQWTFDKDDRVGFSPQPFVDRPASYSGPFRISLARVDLYRTSSFRESNGLVALYLEAQAEPGVKVTGSPSFAVKEIVDDAGRELTTDAASFLPAPPGLQPAAFQNGHASAESRPFTYAGLSPSARRLARVRGTVTFTFALGRETVSMDSLARDATREVADFTVQINETHSGSVQLTVTRKAEGFKADNCIDPASIVVTDTEGVEYRPLPSDLQRYNAFRNGGSFFIHFDRSWYKQARSLKFDLISELYEKHVPFEFRDVPLP